MNPRPVPSAEDRLLGILRLERERLQNQDEGFASLMAEAALHLRSLRNTGHHGDIRAWLPDELDGAAIMLRARGKLA